MKTRPRGLRRASSERSAAKSLRPFGSWTIHLAVDQRGSAGKDAGDVEDGAVEVAPVVAAARKRAPVVALERELGPVAVIFELVNPLGALGRFLDEGRHHGFDEPHA